MTARPGRPVPVLAVMAHPDDAELWAGGTLALHARNAEVVVAVPESEPVRMAEASAAAAALGAQLHVLSASAAVPEVLELMTAARPEVVITHPLSDVHAGHRQIAQTVLAALPDAVIVTGHPQRVYTTDTYNSLTLSGPLRADVIVDITATYETKARALAAHGGTQPTTSHFSVMPGRKRRGGFECSNEMYLPAMVSGQYLSAPAGRNISHRSEASLGSPPRDWRRWRQRTSGARSLRS